MDADQVLWKELHHRGITSVGDLDHAQISELVVRYAVWMPVNVYQKTPWLAPFAVRRGRHRIDARVGGNKRDLWGFPDEAGYFTDDNSLIKSFFKKQRVQDFGRLSPYGTACFRRGMWCCHVWASTTIDPLLFSFVPNLVWLPVSLAHFSDNHLARPPHPVHEMLKEIALFRYFQYRTLTANERVQAAWTKLGILNPAIPKSTKYQMAEFSDSERIVRLVDKRIHRFIEFLDSLGDGASPKAKRFSKRYHSGKGARIDRSVPSVDLVVSGNALNQLRTEINNCRLIADVDLKT